MLSHHALSIQKVVDHFLPDPAVQALILGGSLAHGFAGPDSDIDVLIVVGDADYERRRQAGETQFFSRELCTYDKGYVDGKYLTAAFVQQVADQGSEPARFAFQEAQVLFSRLPEMETLVQAAARYPTEGQTERMGRFYAQLEAWHWYAHEALRLGNPYLYGTAASKLILFGGRLILAHNTLLYPYHKWFLKVLESAADKPAGLMDHLWPLYEDPTTAAVQTFYEAVRDFRVWPKLTANWPAQFMADSELNWLHGSPPVDDL